MIIAAAIIWIILSVPIALFPLLGADQKAIFNYSLLMQIITPTEISPSFSHCFKRSDNFEVRQIGLESDSIKIN